MMLLALLEAIRDESLGLNSLEKYRDELIHVHTKMQIELAEIEKKEAMYFYKLSNPQVTDVSIKRTWRATAEGQRQIELNRYIKAVCKEVDSLKSRIYANL